MYKLPFTAEEVKERLLKIQKLSADSAVHSAGYESAKELIRVDLGYTIEDGSEIKFKAPVDGARTTGLVVYYPNADEVVVSTEFAFADAHGNNVGTVDHLFAENAVVKVILDLDTSMAFVQNADTNAYIENTFLKKDNLTATEVGLGNVDNVKQYSAENPPVVMQSEAPTDTSVIWVDSSDDSIDDISGAINQALAIAKESGEFDGEDGVSPTVTVSKSGKVTTVTMTDVSGTKTATINDGVNGYTPQKGVDYFDGTDGKDGISATHSWNGTTLSVTSASGTSSADLKGEKGDTYILTDDDKAEIAQAVVELIPSDNADWVATKERGDVTVYIPKQTVSDDGVWNNLQASIQYGVLYDVILNGEVYTCSAGAAGIDGFLLGHAVGFNFGDVDDYPFSIWTEMSDYTSGSFIIDGSISFPVTLEVTSHAEYVYNQMPEEYLPDCIVKSVNGITPDENGAVEIEIPVYADGFSPVVSVEKVAGGHRISITDAEDTETFDVMDGTDGIDGQPGLVWRGQWQEDASYDKGDAVFYNGASYICTTSGLPDGFMPGVDGDDWELLCEKGADGAVGTNGKTAYQYAQDGGYAGTETEFSAKLAQEYPNNVSELYNDSGYITKAVEDLENYYKKNETYTQLEINALVSMIPKFSIEVVRALPEDNISETTIYLLKSGTESPELYTEYIYTHEPGAPEDKDGIWEILGQQTVDLTGYATESWVGDQLNTYVKTTDIPVTNVNGKTGDVTLDAASVGARPFDWMPSATEVGAVAYSEQSLTKEQQEVARVNIGAFSKLNENELILNSSTPGSTKRFKITIDDTATITITEDIGIDDLVRTDVSNLVIVGPWNSSTSQYYSCTYSEDLVISNGTITLGETRTISSSAGADAVYNALRGNYVEVNNNIYYIPTEAGFYISTSSYVYKSLIAKVAQQLTLPS